MQDMYAVTAPRSDQLNGEDLLGGRTITIKVTKVTLTLTAEQKCTVNYQGDNGKPYKPCKTMAKVMAEIWGYASKEYVGKSMTLYRDPKIKFGADETGGIRISHMSDIKERKIVTLMSSKGKFKVWTILPLVVSAEAKPVDKPTDDPKLTTDQQAVLIAQIKAARIDNAEFKTQFKVKLSLGELKQSQLAGIAAWIDQVVTARNESLKE
jgi:hypothetical protein